MGRVADVIRSLVGRVGIERDLEGDVRVGGDHRVYQRVGLREERGVEVGAMGNGDEDVGHTRVLR